MAVRDTDILNDEEPAGEGVEVGTGQVEIEHTDTGESTATLEVRQGVRDASGNWSIGEEKATVGNRAYVALVLKVGAGSQVDPSINTVTVRVREDSHLHSGDVKAQRDIVFSLSDGAGWQVKDASGNWVTVGTSPKTPNLGAEPVYYRSAAAWDTTVEPLGHNGSHTLSVVAVNVDTSKTQVRFQKRNASGGWDAPYEAGPAAKAANAQNLVITSASSNDGNEDYARYDPESTDSLLAQPPIISFTFKDGGFAPGDSYEWTVAFVETNSTEVWTQTGTASAPASGLISVTMGTVPRGVYGFNVRIEKKNGGHLVDSATLRSGLLHFSGTHIDVDENENLFLFRYRIEAGDQGIKPLSSVRIDALDGELKHGDSTNGPKVLSQEHTVIAPESSDALGEGRIVVTGVDDEAPHYRDHQNRRLLPQNDAQLHYRLYYLQGPKLAGSVDAGGDVLAKWKKLVRRTVTGKPATIVFIPISTNDTPKHLWEFLAQQTRRRFGAMQYRPVLVNTYAHSNVSLHTISQLKSTSTESGHAPWHNDAGLSGPNDYNLATAPNLQGVSCFNMMGCNTAFNAAGAHGNHVANPNDIASMVATQRGAANSIGYLKLSYSVTRVFLGKNTAQAWYDCLYRFGSGDPTTKASCQEAEAQCLKILDDWGVRDGCTDPNSSLNWGWDEWCVTFPAVPMLDPGR